MIRAALLVDIEKEWFNTKSPYFLGEHKEYKTKIEQLADFLRENKIPIIFTQHIEPKGEAAFQKSTQGIELIPGLSRKPEEPIVTKTRSISPFYKTTLEENLKKLKANHLVVAGIMTNLCVRSVVADAWDREYKITVVTDCCLSDSKETDQSVFKDIQNTRPDVNLLTLKSFISQ